MESDTLLCLPGPLELHCSHRRCRTAVWPNTIESEKINSFKACCFFRLRYLELHAAALHKTMDRCDDKQGGNVYQHLKLKTKREDGKSALF